MYVRPTERLIEKLVHSSLKEAGVPVRTLPWEPGYEIFIRFGRYEDVSTVEIDEGYKKITFNFDLQHLEEEINSRENPEEWLKEFVRHEVAHILIKKLVDLVYWFVPKDMVKNYEEFIEEAEEAVTTNVTILWCNLKKGSK